jgi:hypothetical protein
VVAFTDDDCRPDPGWLGALTASVTGDRLVMGRTLPDPLDGAPQSLTDRTVEFTALTGVLPTCNIAYPRELLERAGGFDTHFVAYGEDADLGQRALRLGATAVFEPGALVFHAVHHMDVAGLLRDRSRMRELGRLVRRHPQLRREAWYGLFVKEDHRMFLEALAGLALLPLTPAGLVYVERYLHVVRLRVGGMPRSRHWRDVAGTIALDGFEVGVCAAGGARYGTVLL